MNFEEIFTTKDTELKSKLAMELKRFGYSNITNKKKFLYADGNAPYLLIAHLDTVHKDSPSIVCYSKDGNYVMSPQGIGGDDRCGVYIIFELLKYLTFKPHIAFTMEEETGGAGADALSYFFIEHGEPELKYIVEYDRKGNNDAVFYSCDNEKFVSFVEGFGFEENYGTFSDISVVAPVLGVAAVNLSSGYYNPHTEHEYISIRDMDNVVKRSITMLNTQSESYKYVKKTYTYSNNASAYYSKKYGSVYATIVPAGLAIIGNYYKHMNTSRELAVDKNGKMYIKNQGFNDYSNYYGEAFFDSGTLPKDLYDQDAAEAINVYSYY